MSKSNQIYKGSYLQGKFVKASDPNGEILSRNPGDLDAETIRFPFSFEHVHEAVTCAVRSQVSWKRMVFEERLTYIKNYTNLISEHAREIARLLSWEVGKPFWESRDEVSSTIRYLKDVLDMPRPFNADSMKVGDAGVTRTFPRGTVCIFTPVIEPVLSLHHTLIPSLLSGNAVIVKSSKYSPQLAQYLAEFIHESGLPSGVFGLLHGSSEVSRRLVIHPSIDVIFYSGPYETGLKIKKQILNDYWKTVVFQTGGKNSLVIWEDCHYEQALKEAIFSSFVTSGQRMTSTSRILVHSKIFDRFLNDFHEYAKKCRVGYGLTDGERAPFLGPLVSEESLENYLGFQGIALREGSEEVMRGKALERDKKGYYVSPSIHLPKDFDPKSIYQKDEILGPDVALYRVESIEETLEILNHNQFGLVASVYSANRETYLKLMEESQVGILNWNRPTIDEVEKLPICGLKKSGNYRPIGRELLGQCTYMMSSLTSEKPMATLSKEFLNS